MLSQNAKLKIVFAVGAFVLAGFTTAAIYLLRHMGLWHWLAHP